MSYFEQVLADHYATYRCPECRRLVGLGPRIISAGVHIHPECFEVRNANRSKALLQPVATFVGAVR